MPQLQHTTPALTWRSLETLIALLTIVMIAMHLVLRFGAGSSELAYSLPLWCALGLGGVPLVWDLLAKAWRQEFAKEYL